MNPPRDCVTAARDWLEDYVGDTGRIDVSVVAGLVARMDRADRLLAELVDDEDCWFDHNGGCQAHGFLHLRQGEVRPMEDVKRHLAARGEAD